MNILVLHNPVNDGATPDDADVLAQVRAVTGALGELGHEVHVHFWPESDEQARSLLEGMAPGAVFNLVESVQGTSRLAHLVPDLVAKLGLPCTGGSAQALEQSTSKLLAKSVLRGGGLPSPAWLDAQGRGPATFPGTYIVKSVWEHASHGLDEENVLAVHSAPHLLTAIRERQKRLGGEWFAEAYVPGREFNLALIEEFGRARVLQPAEIEFQGFPDAKPRVVGYRAKWLEQSFEYQNTVRKLHFPDKDNGLLKELSELAVGCWRAFALSGYARVDFRADETGRPWIIDVNANPCLSPDAGYQAAAQASGLSFVQVVDRLVQAASRPDRES